MTSIFASLNIEALHIVRYSTPVRTVIMAMGLLYGLALWLMCACVGALDPMTRDQ
jgi:hypothetical protein